MMEKLEISRIRVGEQYKALLVGTYLRLKNKQETEEELEELESLAKTFGLDVVEKVAATLRDIDPATYLGKGKVEELKDIVLRKECDLAIFDEEISPQQQRNLEKIFGCTVIDRTELILSVFAQRAETKEAKLQIDLANFRYQLPRLKRLWTHLSRQRTGGASGGYLKGEGEKQIEIDRRILKRKIDLLQKELEKVKKQRKTQKKAREKSSIPTLALVGYTNVGKSTLFHALTEADVLIEDKLFATLDTKAKKFHLPSGQKIILIDTVGFIRKIPHTLIAAFKSTLEEAVEVDILLHLIDASTKMCLFQAEETLSVLKELGAKDKPIITVLNKTDRESAAEHLFRLKVKYPKTVEVSALEKKGFDALFERIEEEIGKIRTSIKLRLPQSEGALFHEIKEKGEILSLEYEANDILLEAKVPEGLEKKLSSFKNLA